MSSFGDMLPDDSRKALIATKIQPGAVFLLFEENAGKDKFIVILGIDTDKIIVGTLYINSEINANVIKTAAQKELQFKLKCTDYSFLRHDSFINSSFILKRNQRNLVDSFYENNGRHVGQINERDFGNLRSIMSMSREISTADKRSFGLI